MNNSKLFRKPLQAPITIGLGSNMRECSTSPSLFISEVVNSLVEYNFVISKVSRPWASLAWPNDKEPMFVNAVIFALTEFSPESVLQYLNIIEGRFGRKRSIRNAPRTLDLDLISYGDVVLKSEQLTLPHPSAHERAFVMGPICDIDKDWVHPVLKLSAGALYKNATIGRDAYPIEDDVWPTF